jgi:hypothetical protein
VSVESNNLPPETKPIERTAAPLDRTGVTSHHLASAEFRSMNAVRPMSEPEDIELAGDLAFFRPIGQVSVEQAMQLVTSAIVFAKEQRIHKLLVDISGLGFPSPDLAARYFCSREWARAASKELRLALVARPAVIDPERFGVTVARNSGLVADVFLSEEEALAWLKSNQ